MESHQDSFQGIGKETLRTLAQHGANVFACSYKQTDEFEEFCKELSAANNVSIWPVYFDMMDSGDSFCEII